MSQSLVKSDVREALPWVRDLSLVGGATAVGAPLAAMVVIGAIHEPWTWAYLGAAGAAGLATGAVLGWLTPRLLKKWLGRWPRAAFICAGVAVGGVWAGLVGAMAGIVGGIAMGHSHLDPLLVGAISALFAAPVGALQLGWFWVSAATRRARRRPVHKLVLGAAVAAPMLAAAPFVVGHFF